MPELVPLWPDALRPKVSLQEWRAEKSNGNGVLICPGGGYSGLATDHEGEQIARWLNERGFDAWILRYTVAAIAPPPLLEAPLQDAQRALSVIHNGPKAPKQLGIWGFSAGGHLAATVSTHWKLPLPAPTGEAMTLVRPDFSILAYPVITMRDWTHGGSRNNLLGRTPTPEQIALYSNEEQINAQTPPTFLFHTADDPAVPIENSLRYALALTQNKVSCELHVYRTGNHGVGLALNNPLLKSWSELLAVWLQQFATVAP